MRFLKGLLGSWVGLTIATVIISAINGSLASFDLLSVGVTNLIFSAVGATVIAFIERSTWSWKNYTIAGALSSGLVLFIGYCVIANAVSSAYGIHLAWTEYALNALVCAISGAVAGAGYRSIAGVQSE